MARSFAGGAATDIISFGAHSPTTLRTLSVWVLADAIDTTPRRIIDHGEGASNNSHEVSHFSSDEFLTYQAVWSNSWASWYCSPFSTGVWHHWLVTYDGSSTANDPVMYIDGSSQSVTETAAPSGTLTSSSQKFYVGNRSSDAARCWDGAIAELAKWNRILTAGEIAALSKAYSPIFFLNGLTLYSSLMGRNSPEIDIRGGLTGTVTGAVAIAHPRIIYPQGSF